MYLRRLLAGTAFLACAAAAFSFAPAAYADTTSTTATLTVVKNVVNDNGGTATPGDFSLTVTDIGTSPMIVTGSSSGVPVTVIPGTYNVTESTASGYTASYSTDCTGTIAAGESKTCTVTNDDDAPIYTATTGTLIVIKKVINDDNNGDWQPGDFTMNVNYQNGNGTSTNSFAGDSNGTPVELTAGRFYDVTEGGNSYTATFSGDCSGKLEVGQTKACTITNDDPIPEDRGKLIVIKHVVNRFGGNKVASNFTLHLEYTTVSDPDKLYPAFVSSPTTAVSFPGNENGTIYYIGLNNYRVTEDVLEGYTVSYSEGCSGVMSSAAKVTCTVTNTENEPIVHGGPGWSPGILEPYFPFGNPNNGGQAGGGSSLGSSTSTGSVASAIPTSTVPVLSDLSLSCRITDPEALLIKPDLTAILGNLGIARNESLESRLNSILVPRIASNETPADVLASIRNFVDYGTQSTLRLGAGERAGSVASFKAAYGYLPVDACDWQNVIRLADTKMPKRRVARDLAAYEKFKSAYKRAPRIGTLADTIAQSLSGYGIRPQTRDMDAERWAVGAFSGLFGHRPSSTDDWDLNRALAYSGVTTRWLPAYLAMSSSRVISIDGLDTGLAFLVK